jgi:hypothetical protein
LALKLPVSKFQLPCMNHAYPFKRKSEIHHYEFISEGPKGSIRKAVKFDRLGDFEEEVFNLSFGDWDEKQNNINVVIISNNGDRDKILAAVLAITILLSNENSISVFAFAGSTQSRTRLYQL